MLDPGGKSILGEGWPEEAQEAGKTWRRRLERSLSEPQVWARKVQQAQSSDRSGWDDWPGLHLPSDLGTWWSTVRSHAGRKLSDAATPDVSQALLKLCLVADEASRGIGIGLPKQSAFLALAAVRLVANDQRSLGWGVPPEKVMILPKQHTPQVGLTLRSLSHNLALCPAGEVTPTWRTPWNYDERLDLINVLLLPWPLELSAKAFEIVGSDDLPRLAEKYRYFSYRHPAGKSDFKAYLKAALEQAKGYVARLHAIVLPELALSCQEYQDAEKVAFEEKALLIAGIACQAGELGLAAETNACVVQPAGLISPKFVISDTLVEHQRMLQRKHHRWCLDEDQILQYELGGMLPASKGCWELTAVSSRELRFFTITDWLTISVLICEDLARQEPAAEILRAVGPNLVVALLMDGPQLRTRWPSHYAGVLADDPGSSVLTLTSLGMSRRSRPRKGEVDRSRTIALWRDAKSTDRDREIELPDKHNAGVLSLVCKSYEEFTADGRGDGGQTHYPVFGGFQSFAVTKGILDGSKTGGRRAPPQRGKPGRRGRDSKPPIRHKAR